LKKRKVWRISIHCSATLTGSAESFRDYHINHNGWSDIGYHYVINNGKHRKHYNGEIEAGRPENVTPAAVRGYNTGSIAICLVGARNKDFTVGQFESLEWLLKDIMDRYDIEPENIKGHRDYSTKAKPIYKNCPCFDVKMFVEKHGLSNYKQ